jgi:hypothetical protein
MKVKWVSGQESLVIELFQTPICLEQLGTFNLLFSPLACRSCSVYPELAEGAPACRIADFFKCPCLLS